MDKPNKMKELILYICDKSKDDPKFDMEKLEIALFLCDVTAYAKLGKSITGETYWKI